MYSEATCEVGKLELCLDAIQTALSTSEGETIFARVETVDAQARVIGKISAKNLSFTF